ncbi:MAG: hypothetical protein M1816_005457 [Peltula sp. TS41687]|nr:MAG: hypothetical protein M1816_005457 [Peltula sp. TS41687]
MTQSCIPLSGSNECPAFRTASISTDVGLISSYPFLAFVSNAEQFDERLNQYISTDYARLKYQQLLGCSNLNLANTSSLYARYTASVICNAIVQNSRAPCSLSEADSRPLCADTCAQQAISEQQIISNGETCSNPSSAAMDQIRADFTVCSLPSNSLSGQCIIGAENEMENCGYSTNLIGLCSYCAKSSPNSTDSCCYNSNVTTRCDGVTLPTFTGLPPLFPTSTPTNSSTPAPPAAAAAAAAGGNGLSAGAIAGIVVGSVLGAALLIGLLIFFLVRRRRRRAEAANVFNQPSPPRRGAPAMVFNPVASNGPPQQGYEVLPGARIARMSALETRSHGSSLRSGAIGPTVTGPGREGQDLSSSDEYGDSPESQNGNGNGRGPLQAPPRMGRRTGSLSSGSALAAAQGATSPLSGSGEENSSPPGVASQQSEQLQSFKDYYSKDEIHPEEKVAVLWAYQPRALDEFQLERGDMIKIVGIWDDGWATGIKLNERMDDWNARQKMRRESGASNSSEGRGSTPPPIGEIKAFPTIEGDGSTETGSSPGNPLSSNQ